MYLDVGDGHTMYYEEHGNLKGKPVVVLHGGPGGGLQRPALRFFDLKKWHVILYDQRGTGKSTPAFSLYKNTTWDLVRDIETLRRHLVIKEWVVFGGSWGSTLALAYASKYPSPIRALVLRGIYLGDKAENDWLYSKAGVSRIFPKEWAAFVKGAGFRSTSKSSIIPVYGKLLRDRKTRKAAAIAWNRWESAVSYLRPTLTNIKDDSNFSLAIFENHYVKHNAWLAPGQLLRAAKRMRFPVQIIQGRYDMVCPAASAIALHDALPNSQLTLTIAGHAGFEPETAAALRAATDRL
jgi:proline iminopeptidase